MQSSGVLLGAEDSAERNDLLRRGFEVSVGSAQMLRSEMGQLIESFGKELETFKQRKKKLSEEMVELTASTARENELMTNELRTSMEARKQLITNRIRASTKSEKESLNTSIEALKQLTEMINELRVSAETEKELLTKELKSSREAVKQLSQELNEVRASTDREKESLNTSKEALKQLSEMMNELRVSAEKEKELLTKKLKSSREAVKQLSQENNELRAAAPSDEYDETDSSSPTLFKKFKGFFVSSKSTTAGRRSHQKTQLKELEVTSEASRDREKVLPTNELQAPREARRDLSRNKSERKASGKRLKEEQGNVKEMEKLRAVSPSNECDQPGASRPTLFRKFKGFFVSSKSTRQGRRSHQKTPKELKSNTEVMQLLAGPSHEYVQEHEERTDRLEILESEEVEMDITEYGRPLE